MGFRCSLFRTFYLSYFLGKNDRRNPKSASTRHNIPVKKKQHIPPPAIFFPPRNTPPIIHTSYFHRYQIPDTRSLKLHCVKFAQFPPVFRVLCQNNTEFPLLSAGVSNLHKFLLFFLSFWRIFIKLQKFLRILQKFKIFF